MADGSGGAVDGSGSDAPRSTIVGNDVATEATRTVVRFAGGLPVQLLPAAQLLRLATERHRPAQDLTDLTDQARASFAAAWNNLTPEGRLLLTAGGRFHPDRVSTTILSDAFARIGFTTSQFTSALDRCLDLSLLSGEVPLRLHTLLGRYVREHVDEVNAEHWHSLRDVLQARFMEASEAVSTNPTDTAAVETLTTFSTDCRQWHDGSQAPASDGIDGMVVGEALLEIGHFAEAQPWYERAVAEGRTGDVHGRVDHASLGISLHQVGYCLSAQGQFEEAQPWFERAVAEKEQGDVHGRVDHASLGVSLHQVGYCLSRRASSRRRSRGMSARSRRRSEATCTAASTTRAWAQPPPVGDCLRRRGSSRRRSRGLSARSRRQNEATCTAASITRAWAASLHQVGLPLVRQGQFAEAQPWFERAVAEAERATCMAASTTRAWAPASTRSAHASRRRGSSRRRSRGLSARSQRKSRATCTAASTTRA